MADASGGFRPAQIPSIFLRYPVGFREGSISSMENTAAP
jgi:hypothetical protein